jgi:hypothetical protein
MATMRAAAITPDWATRPLAAPAGTVPGAVVEVLVTMAVEVDTPGVSVMMVVATEMVETEMVELDADHCEVDEGVTVGVTTMLDELLVTGSGVEKTGVELGVELVVELEVELVVGSGSGTGSAEVDGSAEVVGTAAEEDVRGQPTAVGLHLVTPYTVDIVPTPTS